MCLGGLIILLHLQDSLVIWLVSLPVLALAVAVAVACCVTCTLFKLRRPGAAAGAVGALVQLEPQVCIHRMSRDQSTRDTTLAVDAGVHGLVLVHTES
jgi:hypothetical protein